MSAEKVEYGKIDPFKIIAQNAAASTSPYLEDFGFKVIEESRGEAFFAWEEPDSFRVQVIEGLGTKNLVADAVREKSGKTFYDTIAQDTIATFINDVITSGAKPYLISMYVAAGNSDWFADKERSYDLLINGWKKICDEYKITWGGGESPSLGEIILPEASDLAGIANGIIKPKTRRPILGERLRDGDSIVLIESNGIHANGLTVARKVAANHQDGYFAILPSGTTYGEALLKPTHIYSKLVEKLMAEEVDVHYIVNITGHGWRKLMRPNAPFTFFIYNLPPVPEELDFIKNQKNLPDRIMYETFNMGAGMAFYLPKNEVPKIRSIADSLNFKSMEAGVVLNGNKKVIIKPKNIIFNSEDMKIR